jgi:hypothetical protein
MIQNVIQYPSLKVKSIYKLKLLGIIGVGFEVTDQQLFRYFHSSVTGEKMGVQ